MTLPKHLCDKLGWLHLRRRSHTIERVMEDECPTEATARRQPVVLSSPACVEGGWIGTLAASQDWIAVRVVGCHGK